MPIQDNGTTTTVSELKIGQDTNAITLKINSSGQLLVRNYDDSAAGDIVLDDVTQDAGAFNSITTKTLAVGFSTTATAAGTTTLTVASNMVQVFSGSTTQTVTLPVVSTLPQTGFQFLVINNSTGAVTINSSGGNAVKVLGASTWCLVTCILLTGTTASSWHAAYSGVNTATGKVATINNTITFAGTDAQTYTFPTTSATVARTDAANSFTGTQTVTLIANADGTGAAPTYSFTSDPDTGVFSSGANALGFATGGTERWIINSSGALNPLTDNVNDIGNGTVNPRDVNISRAVKVYGTALIGTAGAGTVAISTIGDGRDFTTVLTLTNFIVGALAGAAAALGIGNKIFTFPAGAHLHHVSYMSLGLTAAGTTNTPNLGVGSVIATGAIAVLSGTATFQDYITGQTAPDLAGGVVAKTSVATAGALTGISVNESGSVKDVFLNAAATWAANNTANLTATGTVTLRWTKLS